MDTARADLADKMNQRRLHLGIRWVEVARRAGMSPQNLSRIRRGEISLTEDAAAGIERALRFVAGSVSKGNPVPLDDRPAPTDGRREQAHSIIVNASLNELMAMANAYVEAFDEEAGEAFLRRAQEIRGEAAEERGLG